MVILFRIIFLRLRLIMALWFGIMEESAIHMVFVTRIEIRALGGSFSSPKGAYLFTIYYIILVLFPASANILQRRHRRVTISPLAQFMDISGGRRDLLIANLNRNMGIDAYVQAP